MNIDFLDYGLALVEGFALILSPCILPILPIMLAGALTGGKKRSLGIMLGFTLSFAAFTLFSRFLVESFAINLDLVRQIAFILIILFGIVLYSDYLSEKFTVFTARIANFGAQYQGGQTDSIFGGILLGIFTSLIWVPCGGPILAAAIIQTAVQTTTAQSFLTFFFFALGSVIPMMMIAFTGNKIINKLGLLKTHLHLLRKIFAVIIIIAASFAAFFGASAAYSPMPNAPNVVVLNDQPAITSNKLMDALSSPYQAPSIDSNATWFNSPPLTLTELKGKVVLIDFWTYSCINCVRTLPYLKAWYEKYQKRGLVIIGVHTPEFQFEKNPDNVQKAIQQYGITYPVVMDSNYVTWTNYQNQYWPAHYLIDKMGQVVYVHFGEGNYAETENNIRVLLGLNEVPTNPATNSASLSSFQQTAETYLGYARAENFSNAQSLSPNQTTLYQFPQTLPQDAWSLQGKWTVQAEKIIAAEDNAAIKIHFFAGKVYAVMGTPNHTPIKIKVLLNGAPISKNAGKDVQDGYVELTQHALYEIVSLPKPMSGIIEFIPEKSGAEFYTFTFGD